MIKRFAALAAILTVSGCGPSAPDHSKNAGATAWLAFHKGRIPEACTIQIIEKYTDAKIIDQKTRDEANAQAMQIAGEFYEVALKGETYIAAGEKQLAVAEEGQRSGKATSKAVDEAKAQLEKAVFDVRMARMNYLGTDECKFDAAHERLGIKVRPELR